MVSRMLNELIFQQQPRAVGAQMLNSNNSQRNLELSRGNRTPGRAQVAANAYLSKTPKNDKGKYRNDVSPFRGRFGGAVKNNSTTDRLRKTPERAQ
jgi:hypothetical protein